MSATELALNTRGIEQLRPTDLTPARGLTQRLAAVAAFGALALVDGLTRFGGFHRLHRLVASFPRIGDTPLRPETVHSICTAVDRAAAYYFKKAWCLQRSATTTCLLRLAGADAEMVIGVEKIPFHAHAWVEIGGDVVNDHPKVQKQYTEIDRC